MNLWTINKISQVELKIFRRRLKIRDICRRNAGLCKQQPNLAPIQCDHERVIFKMEISSRQPIEQAVEIQKRNNYKQKNIDLFFFYLISSNCKPTFFRPFVI